jgi:hypothetical protein
MKSYPKAIKILKFTVLQSSIRHIIKLIIKCKLTTTKEKKKEITKPENAQVTTQIP